MSDSGRTIPAKRWCIICRGLPGSGKSTLARALAADLASRGIEFTVCSSDDHFIDPESGLYRFCLALLPDAHAACQRKCRDAMAAGAHVVMIDNTNVTARECRNYVEFALEHRYEVVFLEPSTPWAFDLDELACRNTHGVPRATIERMLGRWVYGMTVEKALAEPAPGRMTNDERAASQGVQS